MYYLGVRLRLPLLHEEKPGEGVFVDGGILFIDSEEIRILRGVEVWIRHHGDREASFIQLKDGTTHYVMVPMNLVPEDPPRPRRPASPSRPLTSWDQLLREEGL